MPEEKIPDGSIPNGETPEVAEVQGKPWISMVPKELAEKYNETLNGFDTFDSFIDSSIQGMGELDDLRGQYDGRTFIPGENADETEWSTFWGKAGKPETKEEYGLEEDGLADIYDRANLTKEQADILTQGLVDFNQTTQKSFQDERQNVYDNTLKTLRDKHGDQYDAKMRTAQAALQNLGGDHLVRTMQEKGLDNDVEMISFFMKLGELMQEGHIPAGVGVAPKTKGLAGTYDTMKDYE